MTRTLGLPLLLVACEAGPKPLPVAGDFATDDASVADTGASGAPAVPYEPLPAGRLIRRAWLDVLGTVPPVRVVTAAESDLDTELQAIWQEPALEAGLVDFFDRAWSLRLDAYDFTPAEVDDADRAAWAEQVGGEPLHLAARVVTEDLPWSTVVTADWTVATPTLATLWPLELSGADAWTRAQYSDGRPAGGIVFTNGLRWRFPSSPNNQQRVRANALSRMFLCFDYLDLPVEFDRSVLGASGDLSLATRTEPACLSCHETLDPVSAALFGMTAFESYDLTEQSRYHPEREPLGPADLEVDYDWYGAPFAGAVELGEMIATDSRFGLCAVETVARVLWRRDVDPTEDAAELAHLRTVYADAGGRLQPVMAAALQLPTWQAGHLDPQTQPETGVARARLLTPRQLSHAVRDATGYTWTVADTNLLTTATLGFRAIGGGGDPETRSPPADVPGVGHSLVLDRVSWAAASHAVDADLAGDGPGLLVGVTASTRPGDAAFDSALDHAHRALHGLAPEPLDRTDEHDLWQAVFDETGDPASAWAAVVTVLLRDPLFWTL